MPDPAMPPADPGSLLPLELDRVSYEVQGKELIHALSFRLENGRRTLILGPNGSGKSLTLRLCHGLIAPSSGEVRWHGANGRSSTDKERWIASRQAMVFQRPVLLQRTALANVEYALGLKGVSRITRRALAEEALVRTGLSMLGRRQARVLSGGEQQRLALARAWALRPQVLFLDEPTASLDPAATRAVEEAIGAIHASGTKIIMTTHDLGQARRLADEVLFIHRGRLLEHTPAEVFFKEPRTVEGRTFLRGELVL